MSAAVDVLHPAVMNPETFFREVTEHDSNSDDDYEEALVVVKFDDFSDSLFFSESNHMEILDAAGTNPICLVDGFKFAGTHNMNLGTILLFDVKETTNGVDENVVFVGSTTSTIDFSLQSIPVTDAAPA